MKSNVYSKFMPKNSIEKLYEILEDDGQVESMRLAAIWELQIRNQAEKIPVGLESDLEKIIYRRQSDAEILISEEIPDEIQIYKKIKWAANLIYLSLGLQVIYYIIMFSAFNLTVLQDTFILGFIIGMMITLLVGYGISRGINWGIRILVLILTLIFCITLYFGLRNIIALLGTMSNLAYFELAFAIMQTFIRVFVIIFLFSQDTNQWYRTKKVPVQHDVFDQV